MYVCECERTIERTWTKVTIRRKYFFFVMRGIGLIRRVDNNNDDDDDDDDTADNVQVILVYEFPLLLLN